jgi:hypothetical protein
MTLAETAAGATRGRGGLLTLVLKLSVGRVSLSESLLRLTMTLPSDVELTVCHVNTDTHEVCAGTGPQHPRVPGAEDPQSTQP